MMAANKGHIWAPIHAMCLCALALVLLAMIEDDSGDVSEVPL